MSTPFATATRTEPAATDNQVGFILDLMERRDVSGLTGKIRDRVFLIGQAIVAAESYITGERGEMVNRHLTRPLTKAGASKLIELLTALPLRKPEPVNTLPGTETVPAGCYAIDSTEGAVNKTVFYRVGRPDTGRWAGHVFVHRLEGGREIRVPRYQLYGVLGRIAENSLEASKAYGREIGKCGVCGHRLTNDDSRAAGIGPVCAAKF